MTMNPTPDHLEDEILSALLDGDDSAGAADAAAHLGACDRCAARQAELAGARAALIAAPVEPLDELTRRRLVAATLGVADAGEGPAADRLAGGSDGGAGPEVAAIPLRRRGWAQRHPAWIGSAAAVILAVLVGVPFVVGHGGGSNANKSLSAAAPEAAQDAVGGAFLGDLGDLSDRDQLRLRLSGPADNSLQRDYATAAPGEPGAPGAGAAVPAEAPAAASSPSGGAGAVASTTLGAQKSVAGSSGAAKSGAPAPAPYSSSEQASTDRDRADAQACVAALLNGPARGGRLTRSGVGTWRGRPAVVAAFELSGGTVAFVTDRFGCAVLDRFTY